MLSNIIIGVCFAAYIVVTYIERKRLIELLAAKDYADYKNFENSKNNEESKKKNMFIVREKKEE